MLRRQARLRREYLYQKATESRQHKNKSKKELVGQCLLQNNYIHGDIQRNAIKLQEEFKYDTVPRTTNDLDEEYRFAGCEDPKIMITTSHDPSARLKMFVKELRLILPNSQRMNRGKYELKEIVHVCKSNDVTDLIIVHEHRGVPDNLIICHLPYGPTAYFNISGVVMRHDIPDIEHVSEQNPHLIFHNFQTVLGKRVMNILKYIFPVPKEESQRVITFGNHDDFISFRHHTYHFKNNELKLQEVGPRFQLKLYQVKLGTLCQINAADVEWVYRPYMNTSNKKRFLSACDGWAQDFDSTPQKN